MAKLYLLIMLFVFMIILKFYNKEKVIPFENPHIELFDAVYESDD